MRCAHNHISRTIHLTDEKLAVSLGFFDDMYVPAVYLPQPSAFDPVDRAHFWLANPPEGIDGEDLTLHQLLDTPKDERMYIDTGDTVRVRVESDEFYDDEPGPVRKPELNAIPNPVSDAARVLSKRPPYTITVSCQGTCCMTGGSHFKYTVFHGRAGSGTYIVVEWRRHCG